jgi:hypothetical protein
MSKLVNHSPVQYIDLHQGDVVFIPPWCLYTFDYDVNTCTNNHQINHQINNNNIINKSITNNELKIGFLLKECNITQSFRNNVQLSTEVVLKELVYLLGIDTMINEIKNYKWWNK